MKILVIRNEPPWPLCYGGRLHCYELCQRLARRHQLLLVASRPGESEAPSFNFECRVAKNGRLFSDPIDFARENIFPNRWEKYFGINMAFTRDLVKLACDWQPDVAVGMNYQSLSYLSRMKGLPTVCDLQDDEAMHNLLELIYGRSNAAWPTFKALVATIGLECSLIPRVDAVAVNAIADRRFCEWMTLHRRVRVINHGVDCEYYAPNGGLADENSIIFWGSLNFGPNISAILYFAQHVWPVILQKKPQLTWTILGKGGSEKLAPVKKLAGVEWVGYVEDIRPWVRSSSIAVVPMRSGGGVKNKLMEAWAMEKAVLCTPRALGDLPGIHSDNVWIARTSRQMVDGVMTLLEDRPLRNQLAKNGRKTAVEKCSWDHAAQQLERLCVDVILDKRSVQYNIELPKPNTVTTAANDTTPFKVNG